SYLCGPAHRSTSGSQGTPPRPLALSPAESLPALQAVGLTEDCLLLAFAQRPLRSSLVGGPPHTLAILSMIAPRCPAEWSLTGTDLGDRAPLPGDCLAGGRIAREAGLLVIRNASVILLGRDGLEAFTLRVNAPVLSQKPQSKLPGAR